MPALPAGLPAGRQLANQHSGKLARLADVTNNTITKIEAGENPNPTIETVKKSRTRSAFRLMI